MESVVFSVDRRLTDEECPRVEKEWPCSVYYAAYPRLYIAR